MVGARTRKQRSGLEMSALLRPHDLLFEGE
jgi:hypothetical protein